MHTHEHQDDGSVMGSFLLPATNSTAQNAFSFTSIPSLLIKDLWSIVCEYAGDRLCDVQALLFAPQTYRFWWRAWSDRMTALFPDSVIDWMRSHPESFLTGSAVWWRLRHEWGHDWTGMSSESLELLVADPMLEEASVLEDTSLVPYETRVRVNGWPVTCTAIEDMIHNRERKLPFSVDTVAWRPDADPPQWFTKRYEKWFVDAKSNTVRLAGEGKAEGKTFGERAAFLAATGSTVLVSDSLLGKRVREEERAFARRYGSEDENRYAKRGRFQF
jgi:hypothetical protein